VLLDLMTGLQFNAFCQRNPQQIVVSVYVAGPLTHSTPPCHGVCRGLIYATADLFDFCSINLLAPELFFLILAHPVYKM